MMRRPPSSAAQRGVSLLEILVTMVIAALGVMGAAMLSVQAMKLNQGGRYRTQAVMLSVDIAERMEANKAGAIAGGYVIDSDSEVTSGRDCSAEPCSSSDLSAYDLADWSERVRSTLPGASWTLTQVGTGNPAAYQIVIGWVDRPAKPGSESVAAGEQFFYTTSRTVYR